MTAVLQLRAQIRNGEALVDHYREMIERGDPLPPNFTARCQLAARTLVARRELLASELSISPLGVRSPERAHAQYLPTFYPCLTKP